MSRSPYPPGVPGTLFDYNAPPSKHLYQHNFNRPDGLFSIPPPRTAATKHLYDRGVPHLRGKRVRQEVYGQPVKPAEDVSPEFWGQRLPLFQMHEFRKVDRMLNGRPKKPRKPKAGKEKKVKGIAYDIAGNDITEDVRLGRNAVWAASDDGEQGRLQQEREAQQQAPPVIDLRPQLERERRQALKGKDKKRKAVTYMENEATARRRKMKEQMKRAEKAPVKPVAQGTSAPAESRPAPPHETATQPAQARPAAGDALEAKDGVLDAAFGEHKHEQTLAPFNALAPAPDAQPSVARDSTQEQGSIHRPQDGSSSIERWVAQVVDTGASDKVDGGAADHARSQSQA